MYVVIHYYLICVSIDFSTILARVADNSFRFSRRGKLAIQIYNSESYHTLRSYILEPNTRSLSLHIPVLNGCPCLSWGFSAAVEVSRNGPVAVNVCGNVKRRLRASDANYDAVSLRRTTSIVDRFAHLPLKYDTKIIS